MVSKRTPRSASERTSIGRAFDGATWNASESVSVAAGEAVGEDVGPMSGRDPLRDRARRGVFFGA